MPPAAVPWRQFGDWLLALWRAFSLWVLELWRGFTLWLAELGRAFGPWWVEYRLWFWLAVAIAATVYLYRRAATRFGPHDFSANGVVVGRAKQFDNRSLTLILEQLDAALARLNVVSQSIAQNLGASQEQRSTDWSRSLSLAYGAGDKPPAAGDGAKGDGQSNKQADGSADKADGGAAAKRDSPAASPPQGFVPQFASAAGDALTEQMNLAYQIVNLRILNERALSDRLWGEGSRLQVVLGFQVSINPPSWAKDSSISVEGVPG